MFILGFVVGVIITAVVGFVIMFFKKKSSKKEKYIKKGLYKSDFQRNSQGTVTDYVVIAEIGVTERTKGKVKIEIIDMRTSITSDADSMKQLTSIIEGWRNSDDSDIEWFEPHPSDVRDNKIDDILN